MILTPLKKGDLIDIIAPAFKERTSGGLEAAILFAERQGLVTRVSKKIFGGDRQSNDPICAASDTERWSQLRHALLAKDSKAVWCLRGGYGALRLLPQLMKLKKPVHPKLFLGLSDITILHTFLNQKWGWPTVHGPMLEALGREASHADSLPESMRQEAVSLALGQLNTLGHELTAVNARAQKAKRLKGKVTGGNLRTLQSLIGGKLKWQTQDRIIFFEDIGERGYSVDRALEQFQQSGFFAKPRAVIFGPFIGGNERDGTDLTEAAIARFAAKAKFPVYRGVDSGHGKTQRCLILGANNTEIHGRNLIQTLQGKGGIF